MKFNLQQFAAGKEPAPTDERPEPTWFRPAIAEVVKQELGNLLGLYDLPKKPPTISDDERERFEAWKQEEAKKTAGEKPPRRTLADLIPRL